MQLSEHFKREEFACRCGCGQDTVDYTLVVILEDVRMHFGKPVTVTSGNRCLSYNRKIGSSDKSQHPLSKAGDIQVQDTPPQEVYDYLCEKYPDRYGFGNYIDFTHADSRPHKARW